MAELIAGGFILVFGGLYACWAHFLEKELKEIQVLLDEDDL